MTGPGLVWRFDLRLLKHIAQRIGLAVAGVTVGLVLAEVICRMAGMAPLPVTSERAAFWVYHPVYGWAHRPGQEGRFKMASFDTRVSINRQGLRDQDYPFERSTAPRLLVIGDSLAWGFGVDRNEIFTERIEASLPQTEVINAAVSGYSTDQELLWLEKEGVRYRPDLVLVLVSGNDIPMNMKGRVYYKYYKPYFTWNDAEGLMLKQVPVPRLSLPMMWLYRVRQFSALAHNMGHLLHRVRSGFRRSASTAPIPPESVGQTTTSRHMVTARKTGTGKPGATTGRISGAAATLRPHPAQELTIRLIERMRRRCTEMDSRLIVAATRKFWDEDAGFYEDFLRRLDKAGFDVIDIEACPGSRPEAHTLAGDPHWNAAGHAFVADCLLRHIEAKYASLRNVEQP